TAIGQVLPSRIAARMMLLDRRATEPNLILELPRAEHVFTSHPVFTLDPPGFPHTNLGSERHQFGVGVAGNFFLKKTQVFERLPASFDLGAGEELRITGIAERSIAHRERLQPSHIRSHHPGNGSNVITP